MTSIGHTSEMIKGEGEVGVFSAKRWDPISKEDLIKSAIHCHDDAPVVGPNLESNSVCLTVLDAKSED